MSSYRHVELRVAYPGRIVLIDGLIARYELDRVWCADYLLFTRRQRHDDGREELVYALPLIDAIYEMRETGRESGALRYVATRKADPTLHTLRRDQVEAIAEGTSTINAEITKCRAHQVSYGINDALSQEDSDA